MILRYLITAFSLCSPVAANVMGEFRFDFYCLIKKIVVRKRFLLFFLFCFVFLVGVLFEVKIVV